MYTNFNVQANANNPQFGMAIKATPEAVERLGAKVKKLNDWIDIDSYIRMQSNNDVADVLISVANPKKGARSRLVAKVGARTFKEGFFSGIERTIRKASEYAEGLKARSEEVKFEANGKYFESIQARIGKLPSQRVSDKADDIIVNIDN